MGLWVVLCEVVGHIKAAKCPVQVELDLLDAILKPMIAHVKGFGTLHSHLGFKNIMCR
jgi:hypothetical protein